MSEITKFKFRSIMGKIYSTDPDAFDPKLTTSRARSLLNDLYEIANRCDPEATKSVLKKNNA